MNISYKILIKRMTFPCILLFVAAATTMVFHMTQRPMIAYQKGVRLFDQGHYADALPLLHEAAKAAPQDMKKRLLWGKALQYSGDHQGAIEVYNSILKKITE